jgi:phosphatidate cytidylyltransferase
MISALVLAPLVLAAVLLGGLVFTALVAVVAVMALWEWTDVTGADRPELIRLAALVSLPAGLFALSLLDADWPIALIAVPAFLALIAGYWRAEFRWLGLGLLYVSIPCAALIVLRGVDPFGMGAIIFIVAAVWATDIAAYFGGRGLGGPKLWSRISPKKTWSGAITGVVAGAAAGAIVIAFSKPESLTAGFILAGILSVSAQAADLLESAVKRAFGVKDSGRIIPGHGGVLDRVDGLFGAAALAWLLAGVGLGGDILVLPQDIVAMAGGGS